MKISKIASIAIVSSAAFLVGCGSSSHHSSTAVKIKASDAYVVALPSPATLTVGTQTFKTTNVNNGEITFTVPANVKLDKPSFKVPGNAIVDTDGDGKLSPKDQVIRMPLETATAGSVANPIATAALARGDMKAYAASQNFDPVQAKKDLILNPNDAKTKALVAISDGIAFLASEAKKNGKNPLTVIQAVNTDVVDELASNSNSATAQNVTDIVQQVVAPAATQAGVTTAQVTQKVQNVINVIDTAAQAVKEGKLNANQALTAVVAVSDANVNPEVVTQAIQTGNVEQVVNEIPENSEVAQVIEQHNNVNNAAGNAQAGGNAANNASSAANNAEANASNASGNAGQAASEAGNSGYSGGGYSGGSSNTNNISNNNIQGNLINGLLKVDTLTIGGEYNVTYNSQNKTFNTLKLPANDNYSQYFNVKLNAVCASTGIFNGRVNLNVQKVGGNRELNISIPEKITCSNVGGKPVTEISNGTTVAISTNVANVKNALGGNIVYATIDKTLVNSDLKVNLQQLESAVTTNENKIQNLENNLSDFLQKDSNYTVTIKIKDNNGNTVNTINGEIQIGNGGLVNTTVSFNPNLKYFAVNGTLHVAEGSYNGETVKVKVDQPTPSSTSQNIPIYYNNTQVTSISNKYPVGTEIQLGFYKNNSLEKVSGIYTLKQSDIIDNGYIVIK